MKVLLHKSAPNRTASTTPPVFPSSSNNNKGNNKNNNNNNNNNNSTNNNNNTTNNSNNNNSSNNKRHEKPTDTSRSKTEFKQTPEGFHEHPSGDRRSEQEQVHKPNSDDRRCHETAESGDRRRKRNPGSSHGTEIEPKPPPSTPSDTDTPAASETSLPPSSSTASHRTRRPALENTPDDKRRRTMGRYRRSESPRPKETTGTAATAVSTGTTTSSSSSSSRHRLRVYDRHRYEEEQNTDRPAPASCAATQDAPTTGGRARCEGEWDQNPAHEDGSPETEGEGYKPTATATTTTTTTIRLLEEEESEEEEKGVAEEEEEEVFREALKKRGLEMVEQEGDGNCLFRAVSLQVYGDSEVHMDVRRRCLDFMAKDEAHFSEFVVDEPFMQYILRKRQNGVHGNNPEIQAISELYNRPVEVFVPSNGATPINIFQAAYKTCDAPLRLSYHDGNHYNAVTDPLCPTAGLGLGLPGLEPGLADRMQMQKAVDESEDLHADRVARESHEMEVQKAIVESKRDSGKGFEMYYEQKAALMSDVEATDFELEQTALVDSLKSHYGNEAAAGGQKQPWNHHHHHHGARDHRIRRYPGDRYSGSAAEGRVSEGVEAGAAVRSTSFASPLVASLPAAAAAGLDDGDIPAHLLGSGRGGGDTDEYPQTVQELVMNGFALERVVKAYDLIGDNFDDLLAFLMSSGSGS